LTEEAISMREKSTKKSINFNSRREYFSVQLIFHLFDGIIFKENAFRNCLHISPFEFANKGHHAEAMEEIEIKERKGGSNMTL